MVIRLRPLILLFGDSLTERAFGDSVTTFGWASLLSSSYTRRADVLNRGFSGYNTRHALDLLKKGRIFSAGGTKGDQDILFATIFLGANDAALPGEGQHVPIEEYKENLIQIIQQMRTHLNDNVPIFLMTPPPLDEVEWTDAKQKSSPDRRLSVTRTYADEVKVVGKEQGLDVISIFDRLGGMEPKPEYFCDGLHLSDIGNRLVLEAIMELLETKYPHLVPHNDDDADNQEPKSKGDSTIVGIPMEEASWRDLC